MEHQFYLLLFFIIIISYMLFEGIKTLSMLRTELFVLSRALNKEVHGGYLVRRGLQFRDLDSRFEHF